MTSSGVCPLLRSGWELSPGRYEKASSSRRGLSLNTPFFNSGVKQAVLLQSSTIGVQRCSRCPYELEDPPNVHKPFGSVSFRKTVCAPLPVVFFRTYQPPPPPPPEPPPELPPEWPSELPERSPDPPIERCWARFAVTQALMATIMALLAMTVWTTFL